MKLLFVNSCISQRGEASRTLALARAFLDTLRAFIQRRRWRPWRRRRCWR